MSFKDYRWQDRAACRGESTDLFFPRSGVNPHAAKKICRRCQVKEECLAEGVKNEYPLHRYGVWGACRRMSARLYLMGGGRSETSHYYH